MGDWPQIQPYNQAVISTMGAGSIGCELSAYGGTFVSTAWPTANLAMFVPFIIETPFNAQMMAVDNGATVSGNIDVGIFDGQQNRIVSIGTTAQSGAAGVQSFNITDTVLDPGLYYAAIALDNTTGTIRLMASVTAPIPGTFGVLQQASAFVLPATATFAACTQTIIPLINVYGRAVV